MQQNVVTSSFSNTIAWQAMLVTVEQLLCYGGDNRTALQFVVHSSIWKRLVIGGTWVCWHFGVQHGT
jgi:hypothetical protein